MRAGSASGRPPELTPDSTAPKRPPSGGRRQRGRGGPGQDSRLHGIRWVPVPLALLATVIGALVMGSFQGQEASANAHRTGYQAGGLALSVDTMLWLMEMAPSQGYQMPRSEMPGYTPSGDKRLRVAVTVSDVTADVQRYSITDFSLSGPNGKTWKVDPYYRSDSKPSGNLEPGFETTIDLYFDIPAKQARNLTLKWCRSGTTVSIPVSTGGSPGSMHM